YLHTFYSMEKIDGNDTPNSAEAGLNEPEAAPVDSNTVTDNTVTETEAVLPFDISTSIEGINLSGGSGGSVSASNSSAGVDAGSLPTDMLLNFNVDSLNLDNLSGLSGLDFEMSDLLSQVSSQASAALPAFSQDDANASIAVSTTEIPQATVPLAITTDASDRTKANDTVLTLNTNPGSEQSSGPASTNNSSSVAHISTKPTTPMSAPTPRSGASGPPSQQPPGAHGSSSAGLLSTATQPVSGRPANPPRPAHLNAGSSPARPRPARPSGPASSAATHPQNRPSSLGTTGPTLVASQRPGGPPNTPGGGRPPAVRAPQAAATGARPRPLQATTAATGSAMRPVARPAGARPRPVFRPANPGGQQTAVRPPATGRPLPPQRPVLRPTARPAVASGTAMHQRSLSATVVRPNQPISSPSTAAGASTGPKALPVRPPQTTDASAAEPISLQGKTEAHQAQPQSQKQQQQQQRKPQPLSRSPSGNEVLSNDKPVAVTEAEVRSSEETTKATDVDAAEPDFGATGTPITGPEEERYLTESVVVSCPELITPPKGLELLYSLAGAFRSLCHGVSPTNAEWSSLNILAVAWPQLEVAPTAGRRLAQRDIPDVSSMTATDSMRLFEARRPPSSAIHLYRLHAHPPAGWDIGAKVNSIQPSLLPLCDLRMQQQWGEQVSRANMDRLMDVFAVRYPETLSHSQPKQQQQQQQQTQNINDSTADCRMLAASDRAGRFEIFKIDNELNSWQSVYHIDFDHPVISSLWLANTRKYGISRHKTDSNSADAPDVVAPIASLSTHQVTSVLPQQENSIESDGGEKEASDDSLGSWDVDPDIYIRRLPFFGPRNTQGEYALVVLTADGQLVLIYQRDEKWVRIVSPLEPKRREARETVHSSSIEKDVRRSDEEASGPNDSSTEKTTSGMDDPWRNIPKGRISHADMMLVSKKWIYLSVHRAGSSPVDHPHEPGDIPDMLKRNGNISAPTVEVYRIQVEFASDYSPRLFATPLVVQPVTLPLEMATNAQSDLDMDVDAEADLGSSEDTRIPRITHIKLITALNPEVRPVDKNILGEEHYFPLLFVSLCSFSTGEERQQLRYLFAKASDKDYRALMLTWSDGKVEMLKNYQSHEGNGEESKCFDQCVQPLSSSSEWVIGSVLSPHYTTYFQLAMCPRKVELGKNKGTRANSISKSKTNSAVTCTWNQVRILNKEDPTDLVAILANMATHEENQLMPAEISDTKQTSVDVTENGLENAESNKSEYGKRDNAGTVGSGVSSSDTNVAAGFQIPSSRTLSQALYRACMLLANALGVKSLDLDPMASTTPFMRRLLGAIMQIHYLAQHDIQATSLGVMLHSAAVVEARVAIIHKHIIQKVSKQQTLFDIAMSFSDEWVETFPSATALVLWSIDLFAALARDTYLYFNIRCPDSEGAMRPLCELSGSTDALVNRELSYVRSFEGKGPKTSSGSCLLSGGLPCRISLLFHQPTFDAIRNLMTFVTHVEFDLLKRVQLLNSLPAVATDMPEYANMIKSRDMVFSTAQQLAHALEYLPVSIHRLKDFFLEVHDLYSADEECSRLSAQTMLVTASTITGPFRKYLPRLARSFSRFVLESDGIDNASDKPTSPSALVLHDTRWMNVVMCRSNIPGLVDGAGVFETPWRVAVPSVVADLKLVEAGEDALIPAAALEEWEREKSEFERALDEDNVLFDIDDPGFIFFDTSLGGMPDTTDDAYLTEALSRRARLGPNASSIRAMEGRGMAGNAIFNFAARAAALAPVKITTKVPDFSDVFNSRTPIQPALMDTHMNYLFSIPMLFDSVHARTAYSEFSVDDAPSTNGSGRRPFTRSNSVTTQSSCVTPRNAGASISNSWTPAFGGANEMSRAVASRKRHGNVQHFVPQYSGAISGIDSSDELSSGWQFISTPRDSKLHVPTLLEQHAYSLAVLYCKHVQQRQDQSESREGGYDRSGVVASESAALLFPNDDEDSMSYCIDWARSDGIVIESPAIQGIPGLAMSTAGSASSALRADGAGIGPSDCRSGAQEDMFSDALLSKYRQQLKHASSDHADRVDVVRKTMLAANAPTKLCLRCGHITRRGSSGTESNRGNGPDDLSASSVGWVHRFDILCVCGGSWVSL
ncbi:hypothetical protein EV177_004113, partial [Coemansia sp. RSA 1804]